MGDKLGADVDSYPVPHTQQTVLGEPAVIEAIARKFIAIEGDRVLYNLRSSSSYSWRDPEEWVRCSTIAFLLITKGYPANRLETEVLVPRRVPGDFADIVVFRDDRGKQPYLVVENKAARVTDAQRAQGIEQAIGNANSLRSDLALYDDGTVSVLFDTSGAYGAREREENQRGNRERLPEQYTSDGLRWRFIAGDLENDIRPAPPGKLEAKVKRTHSLIWAGGKRDPLNAFDEWSKLLFAKVHDERTTSNGENRRFQVASGETAISVASRIHMLFRDASETDPSIFPEGLRVNLPDTKIRDIVQILQDISIVDTDSDTIGQAFERFFGSVFRGELGQYFTMRQLARFSVAAIGIEHDHYVIDPTAGSGGFLLETLLQGWHSIDHNFAGQSEMARKRYDFAAHHVYGIEIHEILARILKINLLLHHDGHTNIEADRSALDVDFQNIRLRNGWRGGFHRVVGNPPFGDVVKSGDRDLLGSNELEVFTLADGRSALASEQAILERGVDMLKDEGKLAFVLPDGLFNNQGDQSNCPQTRRYLVMNGHIEAVISLPDHAFRKSGAQNKTSILIYRKYSPQERIRFAGAFDAAIAAGSDTDEAVGVGLDELGHSTFMAEPMHIGYTSTGAATPHNELYRPDSDGFIAEEQEGSVLGEFRSFLAAPRTYSSRRQPDTLSISTADAWRAHSSHRLDPKYFLFKKEERSALPDGWIRSQLRDVMTRREELAQPELKPNDRVTVLTISQTGDIRAREAGKGKNPPEWLGMYFEDSPSKWYAANVGDVVFSRIDLWKGCIAVVPEGFDRSLVTGEFPIYALSDERIDPRFLSVLLRSRYYRRAFRAITTGHSNRRRTQTDDFEALEIAFPQDIEEQLRLVTPVLQARAAVGASSELLRRATLDFSDVIDQRGDEVVEEDEPFEEE